MRFKKIIISILFIIFLYLYSTPVLALFEEPTINSEAGLLIEVSNGKVLYQKNATEKMYPASTTKIMTAILALENCDLSEIATVSQNAIHMVPDGYTNAKLVAGEQMTIENLLYALMLNSANEAANVIAEHISGSVESFAELMNQKAIELGCTHTHFVNANGMHDEEHYTTAEDLAKLTIYCMKNREFRNIVSTIKYPLPATEFYPQNDRIMENTNILLSPTSPYYYEYAIGVKTGFTSQAGNCLVTYAEKDDAALVCVTLKADSPKGTYSYRFADSKSLLEYGFEAFSNHTIIEAGKLVEIISIKDATEDTRQLKIVAEKTISDYLSNDIMIEESQSKINLRSDISAPISEGEVLGTITYTIDNMNYTTNLIANNAVEKSITKTIYTKIVEKNSPYISFSLILGVILLIVGIVFLVTVEHKK